MSKRMTVASTNERIDAIIKAYEADKADLQAEHDELVFRVEALEKALEARPARIADKPRKGSSMPPADSPNCPCCGQPKADHKRRCSYYLRSA